MSPDTTWRFLTDGVMGGVSSGNAAITEFDGERFIRMTGDVSTANNGGFIQIRTALTGVGEYALGVRLTVRGNGQRYFVHLRSQDTKRPWHYFQAGFDVTEDWQTIDIPFDDFAPSRGLSLGQPSPARLTSLGIVAYGRDHQARIDVRDVSFY